MEKMFKTAVMGYNVEEVEAYVSSLKTELDAVKKSASESRESNTSLVETKNMANVYYVALNEMRNENNKLKQQLKRIDEIKEELLKSEDEIKGWRYRLSKREAHLQVCEEEVKKQAEEEISAIILKARAESENMLAEAREEMEKERATLDDEKRLLRIKIESISSELKKLMDRIDDGSIRYGG